MKTPGTMTSPRLRLDQSEEILQETQGMRKKGVLGNRYGTLVVTNKRIAFVKAIMKSGLVSGLVNSRGAKPMLSFDRAQTITVERAAIKKLEAIVISDETKSERFLVDSVEIDRLISLLSS